VRVTAHGISSDRIRELLATSNPQTLAAAYSLRRFRNNYLATKALLIVLRAFYQSVAGIADARI
jgi:hypothetical protein